MTEPGYTEDDLALFVDLDRAARSVGVVPCLIGAGAIRLGADLEWRVRLPRATLDWDFAVRVSSWQEFAVLSAALVSGNGGFVSTPVQHRFRHRTGGLLDLVPYGDVEKPPGEIQLHSGNVMTTRGFGALDHHHASFAAGHVNIRTASIPAIMGLKLIAYLDRRPGIIRDIQDAHAILEVSEGSVSDERTERDGFDRLASGDIRYAEIGAYLLGRDLGRAFQPDALEPIVALLQDVGSEGDRAVADVLRASPGLDGDQVVIRFRALHLGIHDR